MTIRDIVMAAAGAGDAPPAPSTDPQFNYVTMLLHGDGTNGAQNNTFVDSSTNNFTITRNGTPTQGSFSPYGDLWSNQFSGTQYFVLGGQSAFSFNADFTIEMWFNAAGAGTGTPKLYESRGSGQEGVYVTIEHSGTSLVFRMSSAARITTTFSYNTWNHVALVRSSGVITMYLNGVSAGTYSTSATTLVGTSRPCIGAYPGFDNFNGYISNLRVVKGTALYTSNFTPSTTPLTAVSGTSLLTCQSNRFRDNSSNNFTITVTGTPSVQRFSPFDPAAEYSTSVIGGSSWSAASSDSLSGTADLSMTGDFTLECWVYPTTTAARNIFVTGNESSGRYAFGIQADSRLYSNQYGTSSLVYGTATIGLNTWTHIAWVRNSTTVTAYVNGVSVGTQTISGTVGNANGWKVAEGVGYVANMRWVRGTAVYTTAFTPPTAPLTAITNTSLLLNCVNAGIFDNAMMNDLVTVGNAQISTAVKKYGTGSMYFDGSGDYLTIPNSVNLTFGTGDFTVEAWVNLNVLGSDRSVIDFRSSTNSFGALYISGSGNVIAFYDGSVTASGTALTAGSWNHVAWVRVGTTLYGYLNGVQQWSRTLSTNITTIGSPKVGADYNGSLSQMNGYIDDLRITKGVARYTANFTPPTVAFPNN